MGRIPRPFFAGLVLFLLWASAPFPAGAAEGGDEEANAIFVSGVLAARTAASEGGDAGRAAATEARRLFDLILLAYADTRPAELIRTGTLPPGVDMSALPDGGQPNPPEGWTNGKQTLAQEYLVAYEADTARLGLVADNADYALMAAATYAESYGDGILDRTAARGWTAVWRYERRDPLNPIGGTATALLFASDGGEHVLAFRGSKTAGDWVTNIGGTPSTKPLTNAQVEAARSIADEVVAAHPDTVFVGHSLGGRLAQVARLRTGKSAVVFNTAPLGANDRIEALRDGANPSSALLSFRSPEDPLTALFSPNDIVVSNITRSDGGSVADAINADYAHSMTFLADAMQDVRLARDDGWIAHVLFQARGAPAASSGEAAEIAATPNPTEGRWLTQDGWEIEIASGAGVVITGGDRNRGIGTTIIEVVQSSADDGTFTARWRYRDGNWGDVRGRIAGGVLSLEDGRFRWQLIQAAAAQTETRSDGGAVQSETQVADTTGLDGHWYYEGVEGVTFLVSGDTAIVTSGALGNRDAAHFSASYPQGTEILTEIARSGNTFTGVWHYRGDERGNVTGQVFPDRIEFDAGHTKWRWFRADQNAAERTYAAATAPADFSDWSGPESQRVMSELRQAAPVVIDEECGEVRGPLTAAQMKTLFERRWLTYVDDKDRTYEQIVQAGEIYESALRFSGYATSAFSVYMCSKGTVPFVATRVAVDRKWFPLKITGIRPVPREQLGANLVSREMFARANPAIPIANRPGCSIGSRAINDFREVRWSGECKDGRPHGDGELQWWNTRGELAWKTTIGDSHWMTLDARMFSGKVAAHLDQSEVFIELTGCTEYGATTRVDLPGSLHRDTLGTPAFVSWLRDAAQTFAAKHCPGQEFKGAAFHRGGNTEPDISAGETPDNNSIIRNLQRAYLLEGREIVAEERRQAIERQAEVRTAQFEAARDAALRRGHDLLATRPGTLEDLLVALEINEIAALALLESGLTLSVPAGDNMTSSEVDGRQQYRISYSVVSPLERLERQLKQDLAQMGYTSTTSLIMDFASNPSPRSMDITCSFSRLGDVPQSEKRMNARMTSYASGGRGYRISVDCG